MLGFGKPEDKDPSENKETAKGKNPSERLDSYKNSETSENKNSSEKKESDKQKDSTQKKGSSKKKESENGPDSGSKKQTKGSIPEKISDCEMLIRNTFHNSSDMVIEVFDTQHEQAMIVYIDGLLNKDLVDRDIITPLKSEEFNGDIGHSLKTHFKVIDSFDLCVKEIVNSNVVVFYGGGNVAYTADLKHWDKRSVEPPEAESVIRGPKEGFTESFRTNTSLIRRKIKNPALVFEDLQLGRQTNTTVALVYIKGIVNRDILQEIKKRLSQIDIDAVLESGYIEQYLDYNGLSPVSGIGLTQKPDVAAARILEGRVAIICDGTPHVLTIPELFIENFQTSEDYYNRVIHSVILRILRMIGLFIGMLLPGLSVAIFTFNQEMIPSAFLTHLIISTQKTPLPASLEAFFLILMFELLRESGTRLPKTVGSAITIVGSLIIGEAAVNAGIVGAPMVIIIALTAVASFIIPNLTEFILIYRFFFLFLGATMGLIGIGTGIMIMLTQLISTESFGIPILSSFSKGEMKDSIVRFPLKSMKYRPRSIAKDNIRRVK